MDNRPLAHLALVESAVEHTQRYPHAGSLSSLVRAWSRMREHEATVGGERFCSYEDAYPDPWTPEEQLDELTLREI